MRMLNENGKQARNSLVQRGMKTQRLHPLPTESDLSCRQQGMGMLSIIPWMVSQRRGCSPLRSFLMAGPSPSVLTEQALNQNKQGMKAAYTGYLFTMCQEGSQDRCFPVILTQPCEVGLSPPFYRCGNKGSIFAKWKTA